MYITIQSSKMYDLSGVYIKYLVQFICSLLFLNSVDTEVESVGDNCRIIRLSSDCCTTSVLRQRCLPMFRSIHGSLPEYGVGNFHAFSSYCYFTFFNINIKLTLNS